MAAQWGQWAAWAGLAVGGAVGLHLAQLAAHDPRVWAASVALIERRIRRQIDPALAGPATGPRVVFAGSSSIRRWRSLSRDMAPLQSLNVGFGGALLPQVAHYADRLIVPWRPVGVVLYAGENDLARMLLRAPVTAEAVVSGWQDLVDKLRRAIPGVAVWGLSLKLSGSRPASWAAVAEVNRQLSDWCETRPDVTWVDSTTPLLDSEGRPRREFFTLDGIHLNARGYAVWTSVLRPRLAAHFGSAVPAPSAELGQESQSA